MCKHKQPLVNIESCFGDIEDHFKYTDKMRLNEVNEIHEVIVKQGYSPSNSFPSVLVPPLYHSASCQSDREIRKEWIPDGLVNAYIEYDPQQKTVRFPRQMLSYSVGCDKVATATIGPYVLKASDITSPACDIKHEAQIGYKIGTKHASQQACKLDDKESFFDDYLNSRMNNIGMNVCSNFNQNSDNDQQNAVGSVSLPDIEERIVPDPKMNTSCDILRTHGGINMLNVEGYCWQSRQRLNENIGAPRNGIKGTDGVKSLNQQNDAAERKESWNVITPIQTHIDGESKSQRPHDANRIYPSFLSSGVKPIRLTPLHELSMNDVLKTKETDRLKSTKSTESPLPALSAYNFFFLDERDRILNGICHDDVPVSSESMEEKQHRLLQNHWQRNRSAKRPHRKSHGKIDFKTLSRTIAQRWKQLPMEHKRFYMETSKKDWMRHKQETKQMNAMAS